MTIRAPWPLSVTRRCGFVGVDVSARQLAEGRAIIAALGLTDISLEVDGLCRKGASKRSASSVHGTG